MRRNLEEAAKRNVGNTVVLARLFNEVQAQNMPNRMVRLILSEYLNTPFTSFYILSKSSIVS